MTRSIRNMMLIAMAMISTTTMFAQNAPQRKTKEEVATLHAKSIAERLNLDEAKTKLFTETFCSLQQQIWEAWTTPIEIKDDMSDEEVEKVITARFEHSQKILDIRKKGYKEYRKFLTPRQIEKVYRLEKQGMNRMLQGHRARKAPAKGHHNGHHAPRVPR